MSKPGAQEFYNSKIDLAAQMGVEFIKYDDMIPWSQNQYPQYIEEFNAVVKAIDKAELKYGKRIVLSISPGDGFQSQYSSAYSKADLLRITGDMWDNPNDLNKIYSRWRESHKINMSSTAFDFDMLPFGFFPTYNRYDSLTIEQKYSFITQRALGASPLFMGGDLLSSDLFSINLITNRGMLECNRNGIVGKSVLGNDSVEIWKTPCATNYNSGWFGVFNKTSRVISFDLKPSLLGFSKDVKSYTFVDIWRGKSVEFDSIELKTMPAYGCIFIKYTAN